MHTMKCINCFLIWHPLIVLILYSIYYFHIYYLIFNKKTLSTHEGGVHTYANSWDGNTIVLNYLVFLWSTSC